MNSDLMAPALLAACERLAQSRQRMQLALSAAPTARGEAAAAEPAGVFADWFTTLASLPGASLLMQMATAWWAKHPYRLAAITVADLAKAAVQPTAQRHPLVLVVGAFAAGGLLAWSRPWRLLTPAVLVALLAGAVAERPSCQA
jgi:hypothetical protein